MQHLELLCEDYLLKESTIHNLLVLGMDVNSLAISAKRSGYSPYAVDFFGDQDLKRTCKASFSVIQQAPMFQSKRMDTYDPSVFLKLTRELLKNSNIDAILLSSGLDDSLEILFELNDLIPILGNPPRTFEKVRNKMTFFQELKKLGISHPETTVVEDFQEGRQKTKDIGYPVLVKPLKSFAGAGIRKVDNLQELKHVFRKATLPAMVQQFVSGTPASISLLSSGYQSATLTVNEQLLGLQAVNQVEPFGYCGNIVPLLENKEVEENCIRLATKVSTHFRLVGSNGIDLVISKEGIPYVIEVNPRFQGSLECVERVLGINLVHAHVNACTKGTLAGTNPPKSFCTRLILFSPTRSLIPDLTIFKETRDIPLSNVIVEKHEPICSIITEENNRKQSFMSARRKAQKIFKLLKPGL